MEREKARGRRKSIAHKATLDCIFHAPVLLDMESVLSLRGTRVAKKRRGERLGDAIREERKKRAILESEQIFEFSLARFVVPNASSIPRSLTRSALHFKTPQGNEQGLPPQTWCSRTRRGTAAAVAPRRRPLPPRGTRPWRRLSEEEHLRPTSPMRPRRPKLPSSTARRRATRCPRPAGRGASRRNWPLSRLWQRPFTAK